MNKLKKGLRVIQDKIRWWRIHSLVHRLLQDKPYIAFLGRRLFLYLPFLLPHDKSFYGFAHLVRKGDGLFLDVGANDGISALGFRHMHRSYRIFSIEPNLCHESHLKKLKNRHMKRFDYLLAGAGQEHQRMTLYIPVLNGVPFYAMASLKKDHALRSINEHTFIKNKNIVILEHGVDILPLDELGLNPDIVKIDTEGHDCEVLMGMKSTIERCRPVILVEFLPDLYPFLKDFLEERRYNFFSYDHARDVFFPFDHRKEKSLHDQKQMGNVFCVPAEKFSGLPMGQFK